MITSSGGGSTRLVLQAYPVLRATAKGVWIDVWGAERFVLNEGTKRFAAATVEDALVSFVARKRRQIRIMTGQMRGVEKQLARALDPRGLGDLAENRSVLCDSMPWLAAPAPSEVAS